MDKIGTPIFHNVYIHASHKQGNRAAAADVYCAQLADRQYTPASSMIWITFAIVSALASLLPDLPRAPVYFVKTTPLFR